MTHPEDTGGGIMTSQLLSAGDNISVVEATELLRSADQDQEEISTQGSRGSYRTRISGESLSTRGTACVRDRLKTGAHG